MNASVRVLHAIVLVTSLLAPACGDDTGAPQGPVGEGGLPAWGAGPIFEERAQELGLDFVHFNGMSGEFYMAETMGAGLALFDADQDGDLDLYLVQGHMLGADKSVAQALIPPMDGPLAQRDRLYNNELVETGTLAFRDATEASGIASHGYGMGVAAGDVDNDGDLDLYVTNLGPNQLFLNDGDGSFRDGTEDVLADGRYSTSAAFFDYDADGWLDLYVTNYVDFSLATHKACYSEMSALDYCGPLSYEPYPDLLLHNRGDGSFEDVSATSRIALEYGGGLGVVASDFNGDSRLDIYVANDAMANQLWINQGDGRFENQALLAGCAFNANGKAEASMGLDAADADGDGDDDLFMTHLKDETNTLYENDGRGLFIDRTVSADLAGRSHAFTGFGTGWLDFDNDGWLDLIAVNGEVQTIAELAHRGEPYPLHQTNQLFHNLGGLRFREITASAGPVFELSEVSRGAALGDVDNDGDTDVVVSNNSGPVRLLLNAVGHRNRWLGLRLVAGHEDQAVRDAYGARVVCVLSDGRELWRRCRADGSYGSSHDPRVLFGLGSAADVERIRVLWPDGREEEWPGAEFALGRYHVLQAGSGQVR